MVSLKRKALFTALPFGLSLLVLLTFLHQEPAYVTKLDPTLLLLNPRSPQSTRPFLRNNLRNVRHVMLYFESYQTLMHPLIARHEGLADL